MCNCSNEIDLCSTCQHEYNAVEGKDDTLLVCVGCGKLRDNITCEVVELIDHMICSDCIHKCRAELYSRCRVQGCLQYWLKGGET
jgi:hypothetical protein